MEHREFKSTIVGIMNCVQDHFKKSPDQQFKVMLACKGGCRRSAATSYVLVKFCTLLGYSVRGPIHLSKKTWWKRYLKDEGAEHEDNAEKDDWVMKAFQMWLDSAP